MKTLTAIALLALMPHAAIGQTHDADFPDEMRAINKCYVHIITQAPEHKADEAYLRACIEEQGFKFCDNCRIFHVKGGLCKDDHENGIHRATCWRSKDSMR